MPMLTSFRPFEFRGHRYDIRVVNAPLELLVLRAEAAKPTRDMSGMLGLVLMEYEWLRENQTRGIHEVFSSGPEGMICTCGLVTGDRPITMVDGHLDSSVSDVTEDPTFGERTHC